VLAQRAASEGWRGKWLGHPSCSQNAHDDTEFVWVKGASLHARGGRVSMLCAMNDGLATSLMRQET
jgi:hypothetical protein